MLRSQLAELELICPVCRLAGRGEQPLRLATVLRAEADGASEDILEGALACDAPSCQREHPIIDGVPVVVANLGGWAEHQLDGVLRRSDLSPWMTSLVGDVAGVGGSFDSDRKNLSTYATAHWSPHADTAGSFGALLRAIFELAAPPAGELALDLGCSVGRGTFALAEAGARLAIGVDLSFDMIRLAERARRTGRVVYPQRQFGVVYEPRDVAAPTEHRARVGFLCADLMNLPIKSGAAQFALAINIIDCVQEPITLLAEIARVLAAGRSAVLATPYDWQTIATPMANWLGGHSQRGGFAGSPEATLRAILAGGAADTGTGLALAGERERIAWDLYVHARSTMRYEVHALHLRRE